MKIPAIILTNGFGQTLAFIKSKNKKVYKILYARIADYLKSNSTLYIKILDDKDLLEWVIFRNLTGLKDLLKG